MPNPTSFINFGGRTLRVGDLELSHSPDVLRDHRIGNVWYVDADNGSDSTNTNKGKTWETAFATMSALDDRLDHGDTIYLSGVLREQWVTPYVNDVTIIGAANTPRQATSGGVANGAGATWLPPASGSVTTDPLLKIMLQGWHVENIYFNHDTATTAPCILIFRDGETPEADASHTVIYRCKFTGGDDGIRGSGGPNFVRIIENTFFNFAGAGDIAISSVTGAGQGVNLEWEIANNLFHNNVHNVIVPMSAGSFVHHNRFVKVGHTVTSTSLIDLTGGEKVIVSENIFGTAPDASPNDTLFVDGTTCLWIANQMSTAVVYGKPDES